jgi:hypothetical protein
MPPARIPSFIESDFKTRVEYEKWVKSLDGSPALAPAAAAPAAASAARGSGGMTSEPDFWDKEKGAPLLRRNAGYLPAGEPLPESVAARVAGWPARSTPSATFQPRSASARRPAGTT